MKITKTLIKECIIIEPKVFNDDRGFFYEQYHAEVFQKETGITTVFVQDNMSKSTYGVIRGLHYQKGAHCQAKLVSVLEGKVLDVVVDLRKDSESFGQHIVLEISEDNKKQLFVPKGCAHGFSVLSDTARFFYKCDAYYNKESETGIVYNDQTLNIDWQLSEEHIIVNEKDLDLPSFKNAYYF